MRPASKLKAAHANYGNPTLHAVLESWECDSATGCVSVRLWLHFLPHHSIQGLQRKPNWYAPIIGSQNDPSTVYSLHCI